MKKNIYLCIDIGYTNTRFAIFINNKIESVKKIKSINSRELANNLGRSRQDIWIEFLKKEISVYISIFKKIDKIGICFPGIVSADGSIWKSNTIWGNTENDLSELEITKKIGIPVKVLNDLSAAIIRYGHMEKFTNDNYIMLVSISSGIGSKIFDIKNKKVILSNHGKNGEIALSVINRNQDAFKNDNGNLNGILGNYSSGVGFTKLLKNELSNIEKVKNYKSKFLEEVKIQNIDSMSRDEINKISVSYIKNNDEFCLEVLNKSIDYFSDILAIVILMNSPDKIILTGGFYTAISEIYSEILIQSLSSKFSFLYDINDFREIIVSGENDDLDNIIGMSMYLNEKKI